MAIARVSQGSEKFTTLAASWSLDGLTPGADDVVVVVLVADQVPAISSVPSGFTLAGAAVTEPASDFETFVYTGKGSDVGAGPWVFNWTGTAAGGAAWASYSGADTASPVVAYSGVNSGGVGNAVIDTPIITPSRVPAMVLGIADTESGVASTFTWDAENTEVVDFNQTSTPGILIGIAERRTTAGVPQQLNGDCSTARGLTKITLALAEDGATAPLTIAHQASGTTPTATGTGTGTTSCAPNYPTSLVGDLLLMAVWIKPDTAVAPTIANWTKVTNGEAGGGGGTTGLDTGPTRLCWYYREVTGTPPTGSLTVTPTSSPNACMAQMFLLRPSTTAIWSVAGANGIDSTTGTPFTAAMGADPGIAAGDMVLVAGSTPTDIAAAAQFSAEVLTASGLLSGPVTEIGEPITTQGNDMGGVVCRWQPHSGPSAGVATFSAVAGGTTTNVRGPICLVRVRATSAGVTNTEAGSARAEPLVSGADVHEAVESGSARADTRVSGADVHEAVEAGSARSRARVSGADVHEAVESGSARASARVSGAKAREFVKTGTVRVGARASGSDVHEAVEAGSARSGRRASGGDVHEAVRTGSARADTRLSGADVHENVESGAARTGRRVSGAAAQEFVKTGSVRVGARASGADSHEAIRAGSVRANTRLSGADAHEAIRSGSARVDTRASGADVFEAVESGSARADTRVSGTSEEVAGGITYAKTGHANVGARAGASPALTISESGRAASGGRASGVSEYVPFAVATRRAQVSWVEFEIPAAVAAPTSVGVSATLKWNVRAPVAATRVLRWNISTSVNSTRILRWNLKAAIAATRILRWSVSTKVNVDRVLRWNVRASAAATRVLRWNISTPVALTRVLRWNISASISSIRVLRWNVRAAVSSIRVLRWDTNGPGVGKTINLLWNVRAAVSTTQVVRWSVRTVVTSTRVLRWNVRATVAAQRVLRWNLRALASVERVLRWDVRMLVSATRVVRWGVRTSVAAMRVLVWNVLSTAVVGVQRVLRWDVRTASALTRTLAWNVSTRVSAIRVVRWAVRTSTFVTRVLRWNLRAPVAVVRTLAWSIATPVAALRVLRWGVRTSVSALRTLRWGVRAPVQSQRTLRWHLRALAAVERVLRWRFAGAPAGQLGGCEIFNEDVTEDVAISTTPVGALIIEAEPIEDEMAIFHEEEEGVDLVTAGVGSMTIENVDKG